MMLGNILSSVEQEENNCQSNQADNSLFTQSAQHCSKIVNNIHSKERNRRTKQNLDRNSQGDQQQGNFSNFANPSFRFFKKSHFLLS